MRALPILVGLAIAPVLTSGCTVRQARVAHRAGEIGVAAGLGGVLTTGIAAVAIPSQEDHLTTVGVAFVPVAVLGALVYIATDSKANAAPERHMSRRERRQNAAWELTKQAAFAARERDCTQVQAIDPRVRDLDLDFHAVVFMRDVAIQRCLRQR